MEKKTVETADITKHHVSLVADTNLWADFFSFDELTINVRQQGDTQYGDILCRIRLGFVTTNDKAALIQRQIRFTPSNNYEFYLKHVTSTYQSLPDNCICFLSTKKQRNEFNGALLSLMLDDVTVIYTKDTVEGKTNVQRKEAWDYLK